MKSIRNTYLFTYPHGNWNIYAYLHSIKPLLPRSFALPLTNIDYLSTCVEASVGCMCACLSGPILHDSIYFVCKTVSRLCVNANQGICLHIKIRSSIFFFSFYVFFFFFLFPLRPSLFSFVRLIVPFEQRKQTFIVSLVSHFKIYDSLMSSRLSSKLLFTT